MLLAGVPARMHMLVKQARLEGHFEMTTPSR